MLRTALIALEVTLVVAGAVLSLLWYSNPHELYEPKIVACASLLAAIGFVHRFGIHRRFRVFISVGACYTQAQEDFLVEFENFLRASGIEPVRAGRDQHSALKPILFVRDRIRQCDAMTVLAFTRVVVESATDKPSADLEDHYESKIEGMRLPTVWNQIEAGIAYGLGMPLFVIIEEGLRTEAMLNADRLEYIGLKTPINSSFFRKPRFVETYLDFIKIAKKQRWRFRW